MKKFFLLPLTLLWVCVAFVQVSPAQDYTRWGLPEGALARLGKGYLDGIAYSPDGTRLAVASTVGIWLYDAHTGTEVALLTRSEGLQTSMAFSPDGSTLASGGWDGTILLWDMSPYVTPQPPDPDFDGDGAVGFADFLQFVAQFGLSQGNAGYDARFDLDGDGTIGFGDFLMFAAAFGTG